jgi:hypothetical protein
MNRPPQQLSVFVMSVRRSSGSSSRAASSWPVARGALRLAPAVVSTRLPGGLFFEIDALDSLTFLGISGRARNSGGLLSLTCRPAAPAESIPVAAIRSAGPDVSGRR